VAGLEPPLATASTPQEKEGGVTSRWPDQAPAPLLHVLVVGAVETELPLQRCTRYKLGASVLTSERVKAPR
jgi:hypothetical protein